MDNPFQNQRGRNMHTTNVVSTFKSILLRWERPVISFTILLVIGLAVFDSFEDYAQGQSNLDLFADLSFSSVIIVILLYLWHLTPFSLSQQNKVLSRQISTTNIEAAQWQQRAAELLKGLGQMVQQQFDCWGLSRAEQQVALLLLKGLTHKEIAIIRQTKSRTVRQQAASIYKKANLNNRAELSAFFLEDLLFTDSNSPQYCN